MTEAITIQESARLIELEKKIASGLQTFIDVGEALAEIRDSKLYRIESGTFEDYCRDKWNMSKAFAFRQIAAAKVAQNLSPIGDTIPKTESQARPLTKLPPEKQPEAWEKAVEKAGGEQPTAKQVQDAVVEVLEPEPIKPPAKLPRYIPALGIQTADNAIRMLGTIATNDTEREEALTKVLNYCKRQLNS